MHEVILNIMVELSPKSVLDFILIPDIRLFEILVYITSCATDLLLYIYKVVWSNPAYTVMVYITIPLIINVLLEMKRWSEIDRCLQTIFISRIIVGEKLGFGSSRTCVNYLSILYDVHKDAIGKLRSVAVGKGLTSCVVPNEELFVDSIVNKWRGAPLLVALIIALINIVGYGLVYSNGHILMNGSDLYGVSDGFMGFIFAHLAVVFVIMIAAYNIALKRSLRRWNSLVNSGNYVSSLMSLHPMVYTTPHRGG